MLKQTLKIYTNRAGEFDKIFQASSSGIVTGRNEVTIHRTEKTLRETVEDFVSLSEEKSKRNMI